jgi:hypothetical protein
MLNWSRLALLPGVTHVSSTSRPATLIVYFVGEGGVMGGRGGEGGGFVSADS